MKIAFYQFIQQQKKTVLLICLLGTIFFSQASGKTVMYGTTQYGGANGKGTIFEYDPVAHTYTAKYSFDGTNGSYPMGSLLEYNGKFYGLTSAGGPRNLGVLFEFNPVNYAYAVIDSFNGVKKGAVPYGSLTLFQNKLYGMTKNGGILDEGVIFFYDPAAGVIKKLWDFNDVTYGKNPYGSLVVYNNTLYGYTTNGGASGNGLMFYWSFEDSTGVKVSDLAAMYGKPYGTPVLYNNKLWGTFRTGGSYNKGALYSFCGVGCGFDLYNEFSNTYHTDGDYPECSVVIYNGKLYGTTTTGGSNGSYGTLYECSLTSPFTFAVKYNFKNDALGYYPCGGLTQYNGKIYGVTRYSNSSAGSIFEYSPSTGTMTNSVAMTSANGYNPGYTTLVPYNVRYKLSVRVFDGATELKDAVVTLTSNNRKVPYNSTAYSMDTVSGIYYYQISKPGYVTKTGAFTIADANYSEGITLSASPVPFITVNTGLSILEGNTLIIPSGKLAAADMQQGASSLTFTVTSAPTHGRLEKTNNAGTAISSFTQDDINNSLIQYVNDGITGTSDGFSFTVDDGTGNTTAVTTFTITVTAVNDAPGFTKGDDVTVNENVSTQTITNWATSISKGGSDESSQTLSFRVTNDNNSLFYTQPSISSSGTLTFRPATNAYGTAIVSVRLGDNGGRVNGGVDSSDVKTFLITVVQPPFMTVSTNSLNIAGSSAGTFSFNINSNISWSVTCSQSWIQLQTSSGSGNNTINITAIDNPATSERTASITVTG
ncbi:MAG TPA: choice-of-anchor tandem repeat GloVer-containing protein, partial [Bacteroidales bacterium]